MVKLIRPAAGFAAAMQMAAGPGYRGGTVGYDQNPNRGARGATSGPAGRIETVNLAVAGLLPHIVNGATGQGTEGTG